MTAEFAGVAENKTTNSLYLSLRGANAVSNAAISLLAMITLVYNGQHSVDEEETQVSIYHVEIPASAGKIDGRICQCGRG